MNKCCWIYYNFSFAFYSDQGSISIEGESDSIIFKWAQMTNKL